MLDRTDHQAAHGVAIAETHFGLKPTNLGYWERYDVVPPWRRSGAA